MSVRVVIALGVFFLWVVAWMVTGSEDEVAVALCHSGTNGLLCRHQELWAIDSRLRGASGDTEASAQSKAMFADMVRVY